MRVKSIVAAVVAFASIAAFAERETAIYRGKLTSDLNANQHSITNLPDGFFPAESDPVWNAQKSDYQPKIDDLETIRTGSSLGATAVQPAAISDMETKTHASDTYQPKGEYLTEEEDPTVPAWAKQPNPPEADLTPATNYTDLATNAVMTDLTARLDKKLDKSDVINPADAEESGKAADAMATKDALDGKLDTLKLYSEEYPGSGGSSLRWLDGYQGLAFGYGSSNYFYPQIRFTDTPYGEIRHVGSVNPARPWSWITIGDSTDENTLQDALDGKADIGDIPVISATNPTFSNAVLAVGLNIDTNSVAVLNEIAATFGGFPIEGTATTVGGLLAALAAAIAWLKKNKVQTLKLEDGSVETSADGGVAKLDDFFTESNGFTPPTNVAGALKNSLLEKSIVLAVTENFADADTTAYGGQN